MEHLNRRPSRPRAVPKLGRYLPGDPLLRFCCLFYPEPLSVMAVLTAFLAAVAALVGPVLAHGGIANYTVGDPPRLVPGVSPLTALRLQQSTCR